MSKHLNDVREFHRKFGIGYEGRPRLPSDDLRMFRLRFLGEELKELGDALGVRVDITFERALPAFALREDEATRLADALDALVDIEYVTHGTAELLGFATAPPKRLNLPPLIDAAGKIIYDVAWDRVHGKNMEKVRGAKEGRAFSDARWDVTKPPGWEAADLTDLVTSGPEDALP